MVDHIPDKQMEAFCARSLKVAEMSANAEHIADCHACQRLFQETLKRVRGDKPIAVNLSPADWFRHDHLDFDRLESFAEKRLDAEETAIVNLHLETCAVCREDYHSFVEFRDVTENKHHPRQTPRPHSPATRKLFSGRKRPAFRWKPAYTVAALLIIGSAIIAAILFSRRGTPEQSSRIYQPPQATPTVSSLQSIQDMPGAQATPGAQGAQETVPSLPAAITPNPIGAPNPTGSGEDMISSLVDGEKIIRFNQAGIVSGLETFPEETRQNITEALLTGIPKRSVDLNEFVNVPEKRSSAALLYPRRVVITEGRPTFRWAPMTGASSYQVRISDPSGNQIANSGPLPSETTQWKPSTRLNRGTIYSWAVIATVNGEEITADTTFKLLEGGKLGELAMLKNKRQSHLALGLFYIREGVLIEARREMESLVRDNPNSAIAAKLLRQSQSWR
jgi:hypothetical protein